MEIQDSFKDKIRLRRDGRYCEFALSKTFYNFLLLGRVGNKILEKFCFYHAWVTGVRFSFLVINKQKTELFSDIGLEVVQSCDTWEGDKKGDEFCNLPAFPPGGNFQTTVQTRGSQGNVISFP